MPCPGDRWRCDKDGRASHAAGDVIDSELPTGGREGLVRPDQPLPTGRVQPTLGGVPLRDRLVTPTSRHVTQARTLDWETIMTFMQVFDPAPCHPALRPFQTGHCTPTPRHRQIGRASCRERV